MVENCQRLGGLKTVLTGTWLKSIETIEFIQCKIMMNMDLCMFLRAKIEGPKKI